MKARGSSPEHLVIRPPSEWRSLLVRVTRGCAWNRCRFCGLYPALGEPDFSTRTPDEVKHDIDLLARREPHTDTIFLGDADPLLLPNRSLKDILTHLRRAFPETKRVTAYARASTLWKKKAAGIRELAEWGLNRVHIGLESGDAGILRFHRKGQTPRMVVECGQWLKQAGIEISFYVLLGLGGKDQWQPHMDGTAAVINAVNPGFIRIRRLWLYGDARSTPACPLWASIADGTFVPQTPEGTVLELRRLIKTLDGITSLVTCDHANNFVKLEGRMPDDQPRMLAEIDAFLNLPEPDRQAHYAAVGNRV